MTERVDDIFAGWLDAAWEAQWPGVHPFLDSRWPSDRWVRFHSLPRGKRYADNDDERKEVIRRHTTVLNELVSGLDDGFIVGWAIVNDEIQQSRWPALFPNGQIWREGALWEHDDDGDIYATYFVDRSFRAAEDLGAVLRAVADEDLWSVFITTPSLTWRYHPYDGGADVITANTATRDELANEYRDWLSERADGL